LTIPFSDFDRLKVKVKDVQLHVRVAGEGDPVLLLHGWPQHSLQWHTVAPRLAESYRVIVPDLPGCGGSSISRGGYDKKSLASVIHGLLQELGVSRVRVVGYDHGAGVAYNLAVSAPDLVSHLVFVEYVLPGCGYEKALLPTPEWHTGSNWQLALFTVPDVAEFAFRGRERELLTWFLWHGSFNPTPVIREHLEEYVDQISKPGALRAGIELYAAVWEDMKANQESMKTKLQMPALGIGGSANAGAFVGKAMAAVAENVEVAVVDKAGHWVSDENPGALTDTLLKFFAKR
jgi:pimeloyl-ACP methyl ester carboxylesterase